MTTNINLPGAFHLNGGEGHPGTLTVTRGVEIVSTLGRRADPAWHTRDAAGHFHAFSVTDERYPTLFHVDVPCGSDHRDDEWWCECRSEYRCRICSAVVVPGTLPGPHQTAMPGLKHWETEVVMECGRCRPPDVGALCTMEAAFRDQTLFGVAMVVGVNTRGNGSRVDYARVMLAGAGPLGELGKR